MRQSRLAGLSLVIYLLTQSLPVAGKSTLPEEAYIKGLKGHPQSYPLSCESRSAADFAAFWGVRVRESKFLNKLPRSDNPNKGFVGKPSDRWGNTPPKSYGVHAEPVAELLKLYGLDVKARHQMDWGALQFEIAKGRPVMVWVVGQMWPGRAMQYQASDHEKVTVAAYEHTMIIVGYTKNNVYAIDAYSGKTLSYNKSAFLKSWSTLGRMAILGFGRIEKKPLVNSQSSFYLPLLIR